jgi:protein TonB
MKGKLFALAASLALHLLFALALITLANWAARFSPPSIEVSAIEFSFAELDSPAPPAAPPPEPPPSPPQTSKPPEREALNIQDAPASNFQAAEPPNIQDAPASNFQAAQPPNQARIDAPPRPLKAIRPEYPKASRQRGEEGDVVLVLSINAQGHVDSASVAESSGYQELDAAAVRAANKARFSPAKRGRTAVASEARVTITFRLTGK